ncbi:MAG: hypothetical protein A2284_14250 [Deltaproteobacteria bacterium RIFOXYA12_FULL_61_11]|nr:MAG: hypothetical protein A2284_14250 [Deltaproteobacteria bacterium RIFOXYA12_FULL_61_11]
MIPSFFTSLAPLFGLLALIMAGFSALEEDRYPGSTTMLHRIRPKLCMVSLVAGFLAILLSWRSQDFRDAAALLLGCLLTIPLLFVVDRPGRTPYALLLALGSATLILGGSSWLPASLLGADFLYRLALGSGLAILLLETEAGTQPELGSWPQRTTEYFALLLALAASSAGHAPEAARTGTVASMLIWASLIASLEHALAFLPKAFRSSCLLPWQSIRSPLFFGGLVGLISLLGPTSTSSGPLLWSIFIVLGVLALDRSIQIPSPFYTKALYLGTALVCTLLGGFTGLLLATLTVGLFLPIATHAMARSSAHLLSVLVPFTLLAIAMPPTANFPLLDRSVFALLGLASGLAFFAARDSLGLSTLAPATLRILYSSPLLLGTTGAIFYPQPTWWLLLGLISALVLLPDQRGGNSVLSPRRAPLSRQRLTFLLALGTLGTVLSMS